MITISELSKKIHDTLDSRPSHHSHHKHQSQARFSSAQQTSANASAINSVVANDITSPIDMPRFNISAMDGYALGTVLDKESGIDLFKQGSSYTIVGESAAGKPYAGNCGAGECIRIMTGAIVPQSCNTVVMQENTNKQNHSITLTQDIPVAKNIRYKGEEITTGETVLNAGQILNASHITLLSSIGIDAIHVSKPLTIGVFSTGDELREADTAQLTDSQIYDCNRPTLQSLLSTMPVLINDYGIIEDKLDTIKYTLETASNECDVIITSGGVSVGDYDYLREAVTSLGKIEQYKVKMKPGKPFVFGSVNDSVYFGLPGNPVSTFIGFDQIVKPALWQLAGASPKPTSLRLKATLTADIKKRVGRADFQRGVIHQDEAFNWFVSPVGAQDSHRIKSLSQANAIMHLSENDSNKSAGDTIIVQPFPWAFY